MRTILSFLFVLGLLLAPAVSSVPVWADEDGGTPAPPPKDGPAAEDAEDQPIEGSAELAAMMDDLRAEAERIRGLAWKHPVPGHMIRRSEIPSAFRKELDHFLPQAEREPYVRALRRLGLVAEDEDPFEMMGSMMAGMAGGFYSPRKKELFVVEGFVGDAARPVLLHELVHALEDQHFDYQGRTLPIAMDTDQTFAATCVVEGSAEHARVLYQQAHPKITAAFMRSMADGSMAQEQLKIMRTVPAFLIVPTMLHYRHGPLLVGRAIRESESGDYKTVMARLFADPPISSEQVLHLERWFTDRRDYPRGILWAGDFAEALGRGWSKLAEYRQGELDLALYVDRWLGGTGGKANLPHMMKAVPVCDRARDAAAGWDGGRIALFEKPGEPIAMIQAWVFDDEAEAKQAGGTLLACLKAQHGEAWEAEGWQAVAPSLGAPLASSRLTYQGRHGPGRIAIRGDQVLIVDGVARDRLDTVWSWALRTRFLHDARDTWGTAPDPAPAGASDGGGEAR